MKKLDTMINDGIMNGTYIETIDNSLKNYRDLKTFYIETFMSVTKI